MLANKVLNINVSQCNCKNNVGGIFYGSLHANSIFTVLGNFMIYVKELHKFQESASDSC